MSLIISIDCQSGNAGAEQREARVETTATGVKWTISGKLAAAIHRMVQENGLTNEQNDRLQSALVADRLAALRMNNDA